MKTNELRIGNYILIDGELTQVTGLTKTSIHFEGGFYTLGFDDGIQPIPLTEEWLIDHKFGKDELFPSSYNVGGELITQIEELFYAHPMVRLKYVHQLQNLYFSLFGKELTLNT